MASETETTEQTADSAQAPSVTSGAETAAAEPSPASNPDKPAKRAKPAGQSARKPSPPRKITGEIKMAAAKKDPAKEAFDTVTAASNEAFKESFEKSVTAMNDFTAFHKETVDAMIASATTTAKSLEEINTAAVAYAKKSMEDSVAAAKTLAGAKSVQELIEAQADFAKSAMDSYLTEVNKHADLVSALVKDSFKPLNDRAAAAVELMQSQR